MSSLFIVTSAIYTKFGVFSAEERLAQTLSSLRSIKERCGADIFLLDAGEAQISEEVKQQLNPYLTGLVEHYGDATIKDIHQSDNWDLVKNFIEVLITKNFLDLLQNNPEFVGRYERIFKLSGRYVLNDRFNYEAHLAAKGKVAIKNPSPTQFNTPEFQSRYHPDYTQQRMARFWSFDRAILPQVTEFYGVIRFNMFNLLKSESKLIDLEHMVHRHFDPDYVEDFDPIGVEGYIAPTGRVVAD